MDGPSSDATDAVTCPECGDTFPSREEFEQHDHAMPLAWERGSSNFDCPVCGVRFDEAADLVTHQASAHPDAQVHGEETP